MDNALLAMAALISERRFLADRFPARWLALKYLENDSQILEMGQAANPETSIRLKDMVRDLSRHLLKTLNTTPEAMIADYRYGYIHSLTQRGVLEHAGDVDRLYLSDRIDRVLTHRVIGPAIMVLVLMGLYQFTFSWSEIPVGWLESAFGWLGGMADTHLPDGLFKSLVISGIIDGVGGVLGFTPLIIFMFLGIAFLEDSGYLARVAYMLDRVFRVFGLHGGSVMAFIVSGGIAGVDLWEGVGLALEYRHDAYETDDDADAVTAKLAIEF